MPLTHLLQMSLKSLPVNTQKKIRSVLTHRADFVFHRSKRSSSSRNCSFDVSFQYQGQRGLGYRPDSALSAMADTTVSLSS